VDATDELTKLKFNTR